ncbi:MAG TPA: BACON domain-containing carbohydrate-binding protein [Blastocatellia bacterium]|nr:BACON domain-containing carbohydrate-binding protein [Blastocatellia bacterium]
MLITFLLTIGLVLPGIPWEEGSGSASAAFAPGPKRQSAGLDAARFSALEKLYAQLSGGAPFSDEEVGILRRFASGGEVSDLEADVVISRALYDYYVGMKGLTREQADLFGRYGSFVAKREQDVADLKTQLLDRRKAFAAASSPPALNVPPANDTCAGAIVIPASGPFPHLTPTVADITDATSTGDPVQPVCQTNLSRSIWYSFTPSATAVYEISSCATDTATTVEDTILAVYSTTNGCAGPIVEVPTSDVTDGCADDECVTEALQAVLTTRLDAGTQYFIVVYEFDNTPPMVNKTAVQLKVTQLLPPANDTCGGAIPLTLNTPVEGDLQAATNNYQLSGSACFTGIGHTASQARGRDVAYSFTAPSAGLYSIRVYDYTDFSSDVVLYAATSCPSGTPPITVGTCLAAANRSFDSTAEELSCLNLTAGQTLTIIVDENLATTGSSFKIEVNQCSPESEPNNTPGTADPNVFGLTGGIQTAGDLDFYSLGTPAAGSRVFALVDGAALGLMDLDLRVTTAVDTIQFDDANNDENFGASSPNIAGAVATGSPVFLRVNHFDTGTVTEPYRLYSVVQPPIGSATAESEPNGTTAQADSAASNYFSGTLSGPAPSADEDVFSFTASAGDLLFVSLDADPLRDNTPINAAIDLLDPSLLVVVSVNDAAGFSSTTPGAGSTSSETPFSPSEALTFRVVTSGTHYVRVKIGTTTVQSNGAGDYLLSISKNGAIGGGGACAFMINPTSQDFPAGGGTGSITVSANPGCDWVASESSDFISITSGASGSGNGTVMFNVAANSGAARSDTITVAGLTFTVNQAAGGGATTFSASGTVTLAAGGSPLQFVRLTFTRISGSGAIPAPVTTDASGNWSQSGFETGSTYRVTPSKKRFTFTPASRDFSAASTSLNFTGSKNADTTGVFRPGNGALFLKNTNASGFADVMLTYGLPGDIPLSGDWNGDGIDTIGVYRNGDFLLRNSNTNGFADIVVSFGVPGDQPIVGDWDGDGIDTIGIYRNGDFLLRNSNTSGPPQLVFSLGVSGDVAISGDWNGDGIDTTGVFRPSNGALFLKNANTTGIADIFLTYGLPGDQPVTGDWNADGIDTIGVYRNGDFLLRNSNTNGFADIVFTLGVNSDRPIKGDWNGLP